MGEYRLYGLSGDVAIKICCYIFMDSQVTNSFTTFYTIYTIIKTRIAELLQGLPQGETPTC